MLTKDDLLKQLRSDVLYRQAIGRARTPEERERIASAVEGYVTSIADALLPLIDHAKRNPGFSKELARAIVADSDVLSSSQATSGTIG